MDRIANFRVCYSSTVYNHKCMYLYSNIKKNHMNFQRGYKYTNKLADSIRVFYKGNLDENFLCKDIHKCIEMN